MQATGDLEREILVVKRECLFQNHTFQGFKPASFAHFESIVLENVEWMPRRLAETNSNYKQPIAYVTVVNPRQEKVFVYQRAGKGTEKRLRGNWSWGVGGHIERKDDGKSKNPIVTSAVRELYEEVEVTLDGGLELLGYINDDSALVHAVHFGVLYAAATSMQAVSPKGDEFSHGKLMDVGDLERICASPDAGVDKWSRIALGPIKNYLAEKRAQ